MTPMTSDRAVYFLERFKHEEKMLGPNEQAALDFAISALSLRSDAHTSGEMRGPCIPVTYCGLATSTHVPVGSDEDHCDLCGHPAQPYAQTNAPPEYDPDAPPDHSADNAADFIFKHLSDALGVDGKWSVSDGTETWDGDVAGTLYNILKAAGIWDEDTNALSPGHPIQGEAVATQWRALEDGEARTGWYPVGYGDQNGWVALAKRWPEKFVVETRALFASQPPTPAGVREITDEMVDEWAERCGMIYVPASIKGNEASILRHIKHAYAEGYAAAAKGAGE